MSGNMDSLSARHLIFNKLLTKVFAHAVVCYSFGYIRILVMFCIRLAMFVFANRGG